MCVSVSVSEWRGSGPPSGNSDKGFSKRERDYIYHSRTDRKRIIQRQKEREWKKEREEETENHLERNNVKWTKCVIVTVGKRLLMSCQTSDCAVNLSVNL